MAAPTEKDALLSSPTTTRVQGLRLRQGLNDSQESLTTHPLLSPAPSSPDHTHTQSGNTPPRYVPYTPRQRTVPSTSSATATTVSIAPTSLHANGGFGATLKLQVQNLKAAAQANGLDNGSVGWAFLEKLTGDFGSEHEWEEIYHLVTCEKATLLLPTEPLPGNLVVTPELIKDHVAFCNSTSSGTLVTLTGLRGKMHGGLLTFRSTVLTSSKQFAALLSSSTASSTLSNLAPLPLLSTSTLPPYPTFHLTSHATSLPFPPRPHHTIPPPLPPRPTLGAPNAASSSRLHIPFSGFFSSRTPTPIPTPSSTLQTIPPAAPRRSDESTSSLPSGDSPLVPVSVYTIDRRIVRKDVGKEVSKALKSEIKEVLSGLPSWVADRVISFTNPLHPFPKVSKSTAMTESSSSELTTSRKRASATLTADPSSQHTLSDSLQTLYNALEDDLTAYWGAGGSPGGFNSKRRDGETEKFDEKSANTVDQREVKVRDAIERVERCICCLFYDRLFRPLTSDDASHDEALASRVAALNMLDLTLDHLGVEIDTEASGGLDAVVASCGKELQRLESPGCRSPQDKVAVLVAAHKVVVDGLSHLPPIHLKPDNDVRDEKVPPKLPPLISDLEMKPGKLSPLEKALPLSPEPAPVPSEDVQHNSTNAPPSQPVNNPTDSPLSPPNELLSPSLPAPPPLPPKQTPTTSVNTDVLLPIIIFSVVKANPAQLVSHLLFTERFRFSGGGGGEESFCLINLMAVVEFLENVDLDALGLGNSERVLSTETLSPIPLAHGTIDSSASAAALSASARLRGKVNQQVGELQTSATKVISGVVDSSFSALKGLLAQSPLPNPIQIPQGDGRVGFGLLRRSSGFSIASMAASLPGGGGVGKKVEGGEEMIDVSSRPGSIRGPIGADEETTSSADSDSASSSHEDGEDGEDSDDEGVPPNNHLKADTRSIRSFTSMMSSESREERKERKSLSDRLASMSALRAVKSRSPTRGEGSIQEHSPPTSRRSSVLPPLPPQNPLPSLNLPPAVRIAPPISRFMDCSAEDLRVGEVRDLLKDYRRVVEGLRALGGFADA